MAKGDPIVTKIDDTTLEVTVPESKTQVPVDAFLAQQQAGLATANQRLIDLTIARDSYGPLIAETQATIDALTKQIDDVVNAKPGDVLDVVAVAGSNG